MEVEEIGWTFLPEGGCSPTSGKKAQVAEEVMVEEILCV